MTEVKKDAVGSLLLPPRVIPVPKTISAEAQLTLASGPMLPPPVWPLTQDKVEWHQFRRQQDAKIARLFAALPAFEGRTESKCVGSAMLHILTPLGITTDLQECAILYIHGGAYVMGGGNLAVKAGECIAAEFRTRTYVCDYRMPPDNPFPAAVDDVVASYREVIAKHRPEKVAFYGVSAGGGLAAAGILKLRDQGLPLPGAAILVTPESDLTESGDTFETNQYIDVVLVRRLRESIELYANGHDLRDPYLSPVFGDFKRGFPKTLLMSGTRDLFLSNTVLLHRALRKAGISADLHVFEAMPHGGFFGAPEDKEALEEQRLFLESHLC